jgi:hypothetical protein
VWQCPSPQKGQNSAIYPFKTLITQSYSTVTCMNDCGRGFDLWMDLLTTYTYDSELQAITAPPLLSTMDKSLQHPLSPFPACYVFISRSLGTASNSGDSSASRAQVLSSQLPVQNCLTTDYSQRYFTTGGLPPISSFWRQAPWDSRPTLFFNWTLAAIALM